MDYLRMGYQMEKGQQYQKMGQFLKLNGKMESILIPYDSVNF